MIIFEDFSFKISRQVFLGCFQNLADEKQKEFLDAAQLFPHMTENPFFLPHITNEIIAIMFMPIYAETSVSK